jgi:hypothetical protein
MPKELVEVLKLNIEDGNFRRSTGTVRNSMVVLEHMGKKDMSENIVVSENSPSRVALL